jgi:hemerythrin-like domain-containing protein
MANEIKPIKRSKELAPLSRDHHDGLMLVWKIRKGIKNGVAPDRIAAYCRWFWDYHLEGHFQREEDLLPTVLPKDHPLLCQMLDEHQVIKRRINGLPDNQVESLELFAKSINDHIRFEERLLFGEVEKVATPEQLRKIEEVLNQEETCPVWEDEFWIIK